MTASGGTPPELVLVHGGGFAASCWDRLLPELAVPALAVDLPGRGTRPQGIDSLTVETSVGAVVEEIERSNLREVVLVGHSLAGVTLPGVIAAVPERLRRAVFLSALVPADGQRAVESLGADLEAVAGELADGAAAEPGILEAELATALFCNDMDDELIAFTLAHRVAESPRRLFERVDLGPMRRSGVPLTYVRLLRDASIPLDQQARIIGQLGGSRRVEVRDLDCGHMAMISQPVELAALLAEVVARP